MKLNPVAPDHARDQDSDLPRLLTAVELVARDHPQLCTLRHVGHVVIQVDSFLLSSAWTLEKASQYGFV